MKTNLFHRTQTQLSKQYTLLLLAFLFSFAVTACWLLYSIQIHEQIQEVQDLADQELAENLNTLTHNPGKTSSEKEQIVVGKGRFFYYVLDAHGRFIDGDEIIPELRQMIMANVKGWVPDQNEIRYNTIHYNEQKTIHIMMAGRAVYSHQKLVGMIYTGKDITFLWSMLKNILVIFLVLLGVFVGVAYGIGKFMAKKAMVPILSSYEKQNEFVANASHELRTPLSIFRSSVEVIETDDSLGEFSHEVLKECKAEINHMTKLITDLLLLARSDSEGMQLHHLSVECNSFLLPILEQFQKNYPEKEITWHYDPSTSPKLIGDPDRLKQMVYILLDNAVKYTNSDGRIQVNWIPSTQESLLLTISDNGIGIAPEDLPRVFDRFYRGDRSRMRDGGAGLGLSIAQSIVNAHKGTITVESQLGKGTTFFICLPILSS